MTLMGRDQKIVFNTVYNETEPITIYELTTKIENVSYSLIRRTVQILVERGYLEYVDGKVAAISPLDAEFALPKQFTKTDTPNVYKRS
jgi:SOS-response transcriptional repressor LexA